MDHIIFEHIRKFDKKDWKSFKTFVSSPYFNKNKRIVQYVEFLALNPSLNDKNALFRAAFPERKHYNDSSLRSIHSEILQLILKFYQIEKLNDSDKATSLDILVQKDQFRTYQLIKNRWLKRSENGLQDEKFFRSKLEMSKIHYEFLSRKEQRKSEVLDQALLDVNYNLDQLYLVEKLQLLAEMQNRGISENESITLLELKTILNKPINRNNQFIQIFTEILTLLSDHAEKSFFGVYELIKKENQKFSKKELKDMFEYIQNFCIRKINQGNDHFLEELYKIYKYQLEEEINVENNKMRISDFKNIATLGIRLKDLDWVRHFTNEHKDKLDLRYQQSAEAYNLARIDFYKEEYSAARKKLVNVEYADIHYELGSRALLIKIYFETTDSELMLQNLNSLKLFVRRSRLISDYQKRIYLNFLKCIHKMNRLIDGDKRVTETLDHLIYEDKAIADYTWVRKKYEEIKSL